MVTSSLTAGATVVRPLSTTAAIRRALVAHLRKSAALRAALVGGIHEGFAPEKANYPFLVYQMAYAPIVRTWGAQMYIAGFDVRIFSDQSVDASNVDVLVNTVLDDAPLVIDGQTTLLCQRVADLVSPDIDDEGRKLFMVGGTYEIWADQPH